MKSKLKIVAGCIITVSLTVCILSYLSNLAERKDSDMKYKDFFEQEADFDVLFMGTSHVINGVFPMELWNDYGIVSYNWGGHANHMATTYWVMENALEYTKPKVMVIDCSLLSSDTKCSETFSNVHLSLDTFPLSVTKVKSIWDLLDDPAMDEAIEKGTVPINGEPRTKIGLLWNYSVFHSRWTELGQSDFEPIPTYEKGAESRIAVTRGNLNKIPSNQKITPGTTGEQYLRKMIEDCQDRGIEVLLTYLPLEATESEQMEANYVYDIAEEYGVDYINFLDLDLINYQTDLYDASHVNPSGARKATDYIGQYLVSNYDISDQRNNEDYSFWHEDYEEYEEMKNQNIAGSNTITRYLMLLSGDNIGITMDVRDKDMFNSDWMTELLGNLGINTDELTENTDFIIIGNGCEDAVIINDLREDGASVVTELGEVCIYFDTDGRYHDGELGYFGLYIDGNECLTGNMNDDTNLQIKVTRGDSVVDTVKFVYNVIPESESIDTVAANR